MHRHALALLCSVHVRVRPLNDLERDKGKAWRVEGNSIWQVDPATDARLSENAYKLDTVFDGYLAWLLGVLCSSKC